MIMSIDAHERRNEPSQATEPPWDENIADKPGIIGTLAPPENAHPDHADGAADEAHRQPISGNTQVRTGKEE